MGERLLKLKEAADRLSVSVRTLWRRIAAGHLPQPVKVGDCSRMPESDVNAYIERLKKERGQ
jgi:excisionase family DNA binding protein